jgi:hypothetical protein
MKKKGVAIGWMKKTFSMCINNYYVVQHLETSQVYKYNIIL